MFKELEEEAKRLNKKKCRNFSNFFGRLLTITEPEEKEKIIEEIGSREYRIRLYNETMRRI